MTQEEIKLALSLLKKIDEEGLFHIEDDKENLYKVTHIKTDIEDFDGEFCISIKCY